MDTLTARKQETDFEYFCRRLAEKELCPNLLPQTGPTGGGDSKVDAETYPVADGIASRWYEGIGRDASQDRWAFAFSAKEDWRAKVQSDVEKIIGTKRDYKLIYFITNQFVKDKARAEVEDSLAHQHGVPVRILDRTWIVERVFANDRLQLAVEALKIPGYDNIVQKVSGPLDTERTAELQEIEAQINDPARYAGIEYQLVEDCLRAAMIARGLELPRVQVDGRFQRAERLAEQVNHRQQRLRVLYARAWTAFWWYDDFTELNSLYDQVEGLAKGALQAQDLELLTNLWTVLNTTVAHGQLDAEAAKVRQRATTLRDELDRLAAEPGRPNNALQARTSRVLVDMQEAMTGGQPLDKFLLELKDIITTSEGLIAYPVTPLAEIVSEMGHVLTDNEAYDELFEALLPIVERRRSEGDAGRGLLERGTQKLRSGKRYDAIRCLGRAQVKLAKYEYRRDLILAQAECGMAYEEAGLLWAARLNMLAAANHALAEFWEQGKLVLSALRCLERLVWLELQLGRIWCGLAWVQTADAVAASLTLEPKLKASFLEQRERQDVFLGALLLKCSLWDLKSLAFLPEVLERLQLPYSRMAVMYALGYEDQLRAEKLIAETEEAQAVLQFFVEWADQLSANDFYSRPELFQLPVVRLESFVLGCKITIETTNNLASIQLGETVLAALEALLATGLGDGLFPYRTGFTIKVRPSDFLTRPVEFQADSIDGEPAMIIRHSDWRKTAGPEERGRLRDCLVEIVTATIQQTIIMDETRLERLVHDEVAFQRALDIANVTTCVGNILGERPKFWEADWQKEATGAGYKLRRVLPWDSDVQKDSEKTGEASTTRPGDGKPPAEICNVDDLKHRDQRIESLIDIPLWDRAKWHATVYAYSGSPSQLPLLALGFREETTAKEIFRGWRTILGDMDREARLGVSVITGVDKARPASYTIVIGTNPKFTSGAESNQRWITISRIKRMEPSDSRNLDGFLARFRSAGGYVLVPAYFADPSGPPQLFLELGIAKQHLRVCPAWQLGVNDPDICAVGTEDDPIIPEGIKDPPILKGRKWIDKRRSTASR
ncbi:hypothetical protein [Candidatus Nitrospira bockiana]